MSINSSNNSDISLGFKLPELLKDLELLDLTIFESLFQLNIQLFFFSELLFKIFVYDFSNVTIVSGTQLSLKLSDKLNLIDELIACITLFFV